MSINCSTNIQHLFNAHRRILSKENGYNGRSPSQEETMTYLLGNSPISKKALKYMEMEEELLMKEILDVKK